MSSSGNLLAVETAYQKLLERHDREGAAAKADRQRAFTHEHEDLGRSYSEIAADVGLDRSRVVQIIKGR